MIFDYSSPAKKYLGKLAKTNPKDAQNILTRIDSLMENPAPPGASRARGKRKEYMRLRVGDFRIIYFVENGVIKITDIGPRKTVWQTFNRRK